jgi:hypothetical protein
MAALAHVGIGLAAKRVAPTVPVGILLLGAMLIDVVWGAFWLLGLDHFPAPGLEVPAPWSHGVFMAVVWSVMATGIAYAVSRNRRTSLFFGALVWSHWLLDFITQPMAAAFPEAGFKMRVFVTESPTIDGLGLYNSALAMNVVEYGTLLAGFVVYALTVRQLRARRRMEAVH